jgi:TetR/AcrR family transcriptional repressor of nem operon
MGRTREFDMDQALDAAISTFWTHGYEATSMADLTEATGLHKGSLYKAFDDKHDIFMKPLGRYLDGAFEHMQSVLAAADSPLGGLRAWLNGVVLLCRDQPVQRGCLALNAAVELGPHDADVTALLQNHHAHATRLLVDTIVSGQRSGEIRTDLDSDRLAKTLFIFSAGLLGASKVLSDTVDPEEMVGSVLAMVRCC